MLKLSALTLALSLVGFGAFAAENAHQHAAAATQVVKLEVTSEGFVPNEVKVKKNVPVKLEVTRKTEKTCVKQLVIKDKDIRLELPLDKTVSVTFTPDKPGSLRYACAMDMISGLLLVD